MGRARVTAPSSPRPANLVGFAHVEEALSVLSSGEALSQEYRPQNPPLSTQSSCLDPRSSLL